MRRCYQGVIFAMAFIINFLNRLRNRFILDLYMCNIPENTTYIKNCQDFTYSVTISSAIGFIFIGNIYDNIEKPRQITVVFLIILSVIAFFQGLFY